MGRPAKPWYWKERDGWYTSVGGRRRCLAKGKANKDGALRAFYRLMLAEAEDEVMSNLGGSREPR